jgi:hypothetical protein
MAPAPLVDDLGPRYAQALGNLVRTDQIVDVNLSPHRSRLENPCLQVVDVRTHTYLVSTNVHTRRLFCLFG